MSNPFRDAYNRTPDDNWLNNLARASLLAAESKFVREPSPPLLSVSLRGRQVTSYDAAKVTMAVQDATAKIGHLLRDPSTDAYRSRKSYREEAPLLARGQVGGTIFFGFATEGQVDGSFDDPLMDIQVQTLAERAALELCAILPQDRGDDRALDAVLSRQKIVRSAVTDLVAAVRETNRDLDLELRSMGEEPVKSVLYHEQADVLHSSLRQGFEDVRQITLNGVLDGRRTRRRLFYLEMEGAPDIQGSVSENLLGDVRANIGRQVVATVEASTHRERSGHSGRTVYRLLSLTAQPSLIALEEES